MAIANGLYEIRSMLLTSMCVDVRGASAIKGANVQLYSANDTNAQKFYVNEDSADVWSIQNAASGLYVDVAGGSAASGTNVQQWTTNASRAQDWKLVDSGTTVTIDGVSCAVVTIGSYVTADGATYVLDVSGAMTTNSANVQIYAANSTDAQSFALYPTTLLDSSMPVPSGIGWAGTIGGADAQGVQPTANKLYPCWYFTDAWDALNDHGFEISYRSRLLANGGATEGAWTDYTAWTNAGVTLYGQTAWLTAGLSATFDGTTYKAMEYALRVRAKGAVNGNTVHSGSVTMTLRAVFAPTIAATAATLNGDSVTLSFSTDYDGGLNAVNVTSILDSGSDECLAKPLMGYGYAPTFSVEVPLNNFKTIPALGTVDVYFEVGTDQYPATGVHVSSSVAFAAAANKTISVSPSLTFNADGTATLTVTDGDTRAAWISSGGETVTLVQPTASTFVLPYPFNVACDYFVSVQDSGGTNWGYASGTITADDSRKIKPCHAWNWDGGFFLLEVSDGFMQTSRTIKANYTEYQLNNRPWTSLKFSDTLGGSFDASGVLKNGLTTSDKAALMALMRAHNVTYRAPSGEVAHVGITDVQYSTLNGRTSVTVSMAQVAR